jgi:hypothetical protein
MVDGRGNLNVSGYQTHRTCFWYQSVSTTTVHTSVYNQREHKTRPAPVTARPQQTWDGLTGRQPQVCSPSDFGMTSTPLPPPSTSLYLKVKFSYNYLTSDYKERCLHVHRTIWIQFSWGESCCTNIFIFIFIFKIKCGIVQSMCLVYRYFFPCFKLMFSPCDFISMGFVVFVV